MMSKKYPALGSGTKGPAVASALVQCQLMNAIADIFEAQVISADVFPAAKGQVAYVRRLIKEIIPGDPDLYTIIQLASELAANAVLHSGSSFFGLLIARTPKGRLRIAVTDEGRKGLPYLHQHQLHGESGRGLQLVHAQAQRWGTVRQAGGGAAVWFDVR